MATQWSTGTYFTYTVQQRVYVSYIKQRDNKNMYDYSKFKSDSFKMSNLVI